MKEDVLVIITTKSEYKEWIKKEFKQNQQQKDLPDFVNDKIGKKEAALLIGKSIPTLNKLISANKLKVYGFGQRGKYLLKPEVLEALKNTNL